MYGFGDFCSTENKNAKIIYEIQIIFGKSRAFQETKMRKNISLNCKIIKIDTYFYEM